MSDWTVTQGDCLDVLRTLDDASVDAVVTDPPYGLSFMGKAWDNAVPSVEVWRECLRVLKPGGHLLAFAGTRTQHRMACAIEDAGFEIRDMIAWIYGSGFPKSLDVSKAIDAAAGAEREVQRHHIQSSTRPNEHAGASAHITMPNSWDITAPATEAARQWEGWGTALKPSLEPVTVARKPLDGTVAANVLKHGTGAINVDSCRVGTDETLGRFNNARTEGTSYVVQREAGLIDNSGGKGRFPANLIHDGSAEVLGVFPETSSNKRNPETCGGQMNNTIYGKFDGRPYDNTYGDSGSAARFFYCAKASKADRDDGCEGLEARQQDTTREEGRPGGDNPRNRGVKPRTNHHPTVKPTDLMRYLCRLVTPPNGLVLDPFTGSGSTGRGAILEGFRFHGIELDADYAEIARKRIEAAVEQRRVETAQQTLF